MAPKLSETVKEVRRAKGWTQRTMAEKIGVDFQTVQRAENAGRNLEKQFVFCLKLLDLCEELEIPARKHLRIVHAKGR